MEYENIKQMKGGNGLIKNEKELIKSWDNRENVFWEVNDGVGDRRNIYSEDLTYEKFRPTNISNRHFVIKIEPPKVDTPSHQHT